jgi:ABC-type nickel/cobalt efflux system permease component RcnA
MKALFLAPVVLSIAVLGAHFMRYGNAIGVAVSLVLIGLVFLRRAWVLRLIQAALFLGALEWMRTLYELMQIRMAQGAPTARMAVIIGVVIVITLGSALLFQTKTLQRMYGLQKNEKSGRTEV